MANNSENKDTIPSMDVTYEWGRVAPELLAKEADSLDSKTLGIFSSASVIISVVTTLVATQTQDIVLSWSILPFIIACVSFFILFCLSMWTLWGRIFMVTDDPQILREDWWPLEPTDTKTKYWTHVEKSFRVNYSSVISKGKALRFTVPLLAIEVISLVVWLFIL